MRGYGHGGVDAAQYRAADVTYRNGDRIEGRALALDDARAGFAHIILDSGMVENGTCDVDRAGIFYLCKGCAVFVNWDVRNVCERPRDKGGIAVLTEHICVNVLLVDGVEL